MTTRRRSKKVRRLRPAGTLQGDEIVYVVEEAGGDWKTTTGAIAELAILEASPVQSVFGRSGDVVAAVDDYAASQVDNDSTVVGDTVKDALETLDAALAGAGAVDSVNGQTGTVVLDPDDLDDTATTNKFTDAADISKLAGIEAGATADQSAAEILTAIKTVDGAASGLDADLLDGNEATAFATAAQGATADTALQPAAIGVSVQAWDAQLDTWAGVTPSANGQSLVAAANYAAMRGLLDLEAGTDFLSPAALAAAYQPLDSDLTTIAGLTATSDNFIQAKSSAWASRTPTQVTADLIAMVGDAGAGGAKGLVPAPAAGDAAASKFLKADGTWTAPSGSGDVVGPAGGVTDGHVVVWDGTTGKLIKTGAVALSDLITSSALATALGDYTLTSSFGTMAFETATDYLTTAAAASGYQPLDADLTALAAAGNSTVLSATTASFTTADETKLDGVEAAADVTDAANVAAAGALMQGRATRVIPASEWNPTITNGAGRSYEELATNDLISDTLDFDATTQEFATAMWCPPKKYNGGPVTFRVKHRLPGAASTETVDYALSGVFIRDDDPVDAAPGTAVVVTDTFIAAGDLHVSPESAAVTFGGTYAAGCKVMLRLQRNVSTDNAAGDAKVEAVEIFSTSNAANDA